MREVLGDEFTALPSEVQEYVGNLTWMGTLKKFLSELRAEYEISQDGSDAIIMLTGGGSLMQCVADEVKAQFPNAAIYYDPQAISAIGQGIAFWAPDKIKAIEFKDAFDNNFIHRDGENVVLPKLLEAFGECAVEISRDVIDEERDAVIHAINIWRNYDCNGTAIPSKIEAHFKNWCENTGIPKFNQKIDEHIAALKNTLNADFKKYVLEPSNMLTGDPNKDTLLLSTDRVFLSDSRGLFKVIFEILTKHIVEYYKKNELWDHFPNKSKGWLFSDPRGDFYEQNVNFLNDWLNDQSQATGKLCYNLFVEQELPIGNRNMTMCSYFVIEGWSDMENLMDKRTKEILGRLVLEEMLDDEED